VPDHRERIDPIRAELLSASWDHLAPHHARGALVAVDRDLDVVEAALAIASNQTAVVAAWLGSGHLVKVDDAQWAAWKGRRFTAAIVQPFVVIAPIAAPAGEA